MSTPFNTYFPSGLIGLVVLTANFVTFLVMMSGPTLNPESYLESSGFNLFQYRRDCLKTLIVNTIIMFLVLAVMIVTSRRPAAPAIEKNRLSEASMLFPAATSLDSMLMPLIILTIMGALAIDMVIDLLLRLVSRGKYCTISSSDTGVVFVSYVICLAVMIIVEVLVVAGSA